MADKTPIRGAYSGASLTGLAEYATGDTIGVSFGGTGLATVGSNQLLTGSGTGALTSESSLTFDGTTLATTAFTATGNVSLDGGTFVFNESGADKDFRVEGDSEANLLMIDASTDRIGIGTATPSHLVDIEGVGHAATCFVSADLCATTKVVSPALCIGSQYALPAADGSAGQIMCTDGSGALAFATASAGVTLAGSTNNTIATVTGSDALAGEANLTFDGSTLAVAGALTATGNVSFDGGTFVFNESGADKDFRIEGDTDANLFFVDASKDNIGIGTSTIPDYSMLTLVRDAITWGTVQGGLISISQNGCINSTYIERNSAIYIQAPADSSDLHIGVDSSGKGAYFQTSEQAVAWGTRPIVFQPLAGNVGIGTATVGGLLHASQTTAGAWTGRFDNNQTDGPTLYANHTGGSSSTNSVFRVDGNSTTAFNVKSDQTVLIGYYSGSWADSYGSTFYPGGSAIYHVNGGVAIILRRATSYGDIMQFSHNVGGAAYVGSISVAASSTAYNTSSDYRLKENVIDLTGATTRVAQLQPHRFNFIRDPDTTVDGFVAHEVSDIVPEAITGTKDETRDAKNVIVNADEEILEENKTEAEWTSGKERTLVSEAVDAVDAVLYADGDEIPDGKSVGDVKTPAIDAAAAVYDDPIYAADTVWHETLTVPKYQGIDQAKLVPLLTAAIQELTARVEALESA